MNRRTMLTALGAGCASTFLATPSFGQSYGAQSRGECGPPTPANAEGPFYLPGAPETSTLNSEGRLVVSGRILNASCGPARNGVIEVWQANEEGEYDLQGFRNRGIVRCNDDGAYSFRTVRPGHYLNGGTYRPAHIHVKVHLDGRSPLTTQLYFQGDPHNERDPWFRDSLVLRSTPRGGCHSPNPSRAHRTTFTFVV